MELEYINIINEKYGIKEEIDESDKKILAYLEVKFCCDCKILKNIDVFDYMRKNDMKFQKRRMFMDSKAN